jgi:hypothetical protein
MSRAVHCAYHCATCRLHFHSLRAFDAHREGDYRSNDPELGRHCVHPLDKDGDPFVKLTTEGICTMREPVDGITVYTLAAALEATRKAWPPAVSSDGLRSFHGSPDELVAA